MHSSRLRRSLFVAAFALFAAPAAFGQWMWKDDGGHVVASDRPPPIGTPASRILKEPRARAAVPEPAPSQKDGARDGTREGAREPGKSESAKTLAERELDSRQRQKDAAEAAKKSDEEATKTRAMQENCNAVRGNLVALQAGGRAARFNPNGERVYLDDAQRQAEVAKSQGQIAQYCK